MQDLVRIRKKRRGFSMIETIAAVAIVGLLTITIGRVSTMKIATQNSVDAQYSVLSADAFMSDIYHDFHQSVSYEFTESPAGQRMLTFVRFDGTAGIYSFDPNTGACYTDGIWQFNATRFDVVGTPNNIVVSVKLPNERLLDFSIYR